LHDNKSVASCLLKRLDDWRGSGGAFRFAGDACRPYEILVFVAQTPFPLAANDNERREMRRFSLITGVCYEARVHAIHSPPAATV